MLQRATGLVTQKCDLNGDNVVSPADLVLLRAKFGQKANGAGDPADANSDGIINIADYRYCQLHLTANTP